MLIHLSTSSSSEVLSCYYTISFCLTQTLWLKHEESFKYLYRTDFITGCSLWIGVDNHLWKYTRYDEEIVSICLSLLQDGLVALILNYKNNR